ncbi:hypothetical protein PspLS_07781 [Pyricularia sp. CBS 133598]|nr:hypothetical protein PspLS_07781 [Pyricularia sp. CBS 133598]
MVCQARHTKYSEPVAPPFAMPPTQFDVRDLEPSRSNMPSSSDTGIRQKAGIPGVRCPTCAASGSEVWVIQGRACGTCGTPCF